MTENDSTMTTVTERGGRSMEDLTTVQTAAWMQYHSEVLSEWRRAYLATWRAHSAPVMSEDDPRYSQLPYQRGEFEVFAELYAESWFNEVLEDKPSPPIEAFPDWVSAVSARMSALTGAEHWESNDPSAVIWLESGNVSAGSSSALVSQMVSINLLTGEWVVHPADVSVTYTDGAVHVRVSDSGGLGETISAAYTLWGRQPAAPEDSNR